MSFLLVANQIRRTVLVTTIALRMVTFFGGTPIAIASAVSVNASGIQNQVTTGLQVEVVERFTPNDFLLQTNEHRELAGVPNLVLNDELNAAAHAKAMDMAQKGYWDHFRPSDHKAPWDFISDSGYAYHVAGENLARGYRTPAGITTAWMQSPAHRANLLSAKYTEVGYDCIEIADQDGQPILVTVQMFGSR